MFSSCENIGFVHSDCMPNADLQNLGVGVSACARVGAYFRASLTFAPENEVVSARSGGLSFAECGIRNSDPLLTHASKTPYFSESTLTSTQNQLLGHFPCFGVGVESRLGACTYDVC